jgi:DNA-binding response OmpR family regulator
MEPIIYEDRFSSFMAFNLQHTKPLVYIVDDDPDILLLLKHIIGTNQCDILTFTSPQQLLDAVEYQIPHLVITDLNMPEMDGISLVAELRRRSQTLPIIMLSGEPSTEFFLSATAVGVNNYFTKPINMSEFRG